jgi:hypothetical protein
VSAIFGRMVSLNLINSFAMSRTKPNMNPPNGRSIYYGSGHPIPAFYGIERTSPWLLSLLLGRHSNAVWSSVLRCKRSKLKDGFNLPFLDDTFHFWTAICVICALG